MVSVIVLIEVIIGFLVFESEGIDIGYLPLIIETSHNICAEICEDGNRHTLCDPVSISFLSLYVNFAMTEFLLLDCGAQR